MDTQEILVASAIAAVPTIFFGIMGFLIKRSIKRTDDDTQELRTDIQHLRNDIAQQHEKIARVDSHEEAVKDIKTLQNDFSRFDVRLALVEQSNEDFKQYLDERFTRMEKGQEALYNQVNSKLDSFEKDIRELWRGQNGGGK